MATLLIFILLIAFYETQALENNYYQACWDVKLTDENMFCYGSVNWKIDEETYYNQEQQDAIAKDMYRNLLFKWENRTREDPQSPQNHCLAIARQVFCAHTFRRCRDYEAPKQPMCDWMCDLFINRCDEEEDLIELICSTSGKMKSCSDAKEHYGSVNFKDWRNIPAAAFLLGGYIMY